jgi:hypothetical protein
MTGRLVRGQVGVTMVLIAVQKNGDRNGCLAGG